MRVAVVGGTGLVGRHTMTALQRDGHDPVSLSRSSGVDVITGAGLEDGLAGVEAVIDVTNTAAQDPDETRQFFGTVTENLLAAEQQAGVRHHLLLSIVGVDRVEDNAHYVGKVHQEQLVQAGAIPFTILRATQFFEFAEMVVGWVRDGDTATLPPLLLQPVAAADVGDVLAELATGPPQQGTIDLAGPAPQDFVDMARRALTARGDTTTLVPSWHGGLFGLTMSGDVLLPDDDARIAPTTFDAWLGA